MTLPQVHVIKTMSSIELVATINAMRESGRAELLHKNFMVKIENHPGIDSAKFLAHVQVAGPNGSTRQSKYYNLPEREAKLMVMSESLKVQMAVLDHMTELETKVALPAAPSVKPDLITQHIASMRFMRAAMAFAKESNLVDASATLAADKWTETVTGISPLTMMGYTPVAAQLTVPEQLSLTCTPTELGKAHNLSAIAVNRMLVDIGYQTKEGNTWVPTEQGKPHAEWLDTQKWCSGGVSLKQLKWSRYVLEGNFFGAPSH